MKAWRLAGLGGTLTFEDIDMPEVRPGSVLLRMEATPLLSYLKDYISGKLPTYSAPPGTFTPGTGGIAAVEAVGRDVWQLAPGRRVVVSPHLVSAENVADPLQILIGLTSFGPGSERVQADWRDGALAQYMLAPLTTVTPADGLEQFPATQLAVLNRFIVPFGGLLRSRLAAGETLVVNGATGAFGTAAALLGVALGAARVIAAGRNAAALEALVGVTGVRVTAVRLNGNVEQDAAALREAAGGGAHVAFDIVGRATDPNATLAALRSLRRGGRLVLMGSMTVPLPLSYAEIMNNDWEILGQFMYPASAYRRLIGLVRAGLLDITAIRPHVFPLAELPRAMDAAATAGNLECVVVEPNGALKSQTGTAT